VGEQVKQKMARNWGVIKGSILFTIPGPQQHNDDDALDKE
jgi:hypothetical protein